MEKKVDYFFEVSFEVANRVGGIYAVLESKTKAMKKVYGENYITIGFFDPQKSKMEFEPRNPEELRGIFDELVKEGITCYYGIWTVGGRSKTILLDIKSYIKNKNDIKKELWDNYKIDSLGTGDDFDIPIVWSYAVGKLLEKLSEVYKNKKIVAQFHEWLSGGALLYAKNKNLNMGLVFTTHATMLGRTMAGHGDDLPKQIEEGLKEKKCVDISKAYDYNMQAKHLTEIACAREADVFTTVSETTSKEAEYILCKKPDVLLLNGLDISDFPAMEELSYLHKKYKAKIVDFLRGYFASYYDIDLKEPKIIFISGRYEFHNKGVDIFIKSLAKLNRELKRKKDSKDIFAFIFMPTGVRGESFEVLENLSLYREIEEHINELLPEIQERMLYSITKGGTMYKEVIDFLEREFSEKCRKLIVAFKSREGENPPICAYDLDYDSKKDPILNALKNNGLLNRKEDKVKVIFYPVYISTADRLLNLDYYPAIIGCSLGVFPSYYEPWGYTPLEAAANGVISITTDYSGFGQFISKNTKQDGKEGVMVLRRVGRNEVDIVNDLANIIRDTINLDKHTLVSKKHNAKDLATLTDWSNLAKNYIQAHNMAVERCRKRCSLS